MIERILFAVVFGIAVVAISVFSGKIFSIGLHLSKLTQSKVLLVSVLVPLIYIANFIVVRSSSTGIAGFLYAFFNIVGGVFFYLFIGAGILSLVLIVGFIARVSIPGWISITILSLSFLFSIIGFVQAQMIRITSYDIVLANLPSEWQGKKAALVSDTHFSPINRHRFSEKIVRTISAQSPDMVFHAGDFYDGPMIELAPVTSHWKKLAETIPVFYAPGNHEEYGDYATFIASIRDTGAIVLEDTAVTHNGVHIAGLRYRTPTQNEATGAVLKQMNLNGSTPTILINHPPTFQKEAIAEGVDLMVSGHTHNGQFWPLNYLVRRIYGRYTYGYTSDGTLQSIITSGVGTFGPPLRLFNPPEIVIITFKGK